MQKYLSKTFEFKKYKTNMRTEIVAGFTTFATMGYIMFLNPFILSGEFAGESKGFMSFEFVYTATILASAIACFIMGFVGKTFPIGLAPGMGINAFVAFGVMGGMKYSPQEALALVLLSGILFLAVSLTPIRKYLINAIPRSLKLGIGAGIGLFLAIIGFEIMGLSVDHPVTLVTIGDVTNPLLILGGLAFVTMVVLEKYKIKGNILLSLIFFSFLAWLPIWGFTGSTIEGSNALGYFLSAFDGFTPRVFSGSALTVIFTLFFIDLFDTMGTLTSAANVCGRVNKKGEVENIEGPLVADSVGTVAGSLIGTSTVTSYVESGAGIKAGGRTGFVSIVVGIAFLLCLGFAPLATSLPKEVDAAALIYVAILFVRNITDISWNDISESSAAVVAMIAMPLTYSIANGIALAFVTYAAVRILSGQANRTSGAIWIVAILSILSFVV